MNKKVVKVAAWVTTLGVVLVTGALLGGGAVYALTQKDNDNIQRVSAAQAAQIDEEPGVLIAGIVPDSPVAAAGLVRGDILLEIDDQTVDDVLTLRTYLADKAPGDEVSLTVLHGDDERTVTATLADRNGQAYLGLVPCGPHLANHVIGGPGAYFEFTDDTPGAVVLSVAPGSPAAEAGLERGNVITAIDGQALDQDASLREIIEGYQPGDQITLEVKGQAEETETLTVTLAENPDQPGAAYLGVGYGPSIAVFEGAGPGPFSEAEPLSARYRFFGPDSDITQGAIIQEVAEGSPAADAGLTEGDIIQTIDGEPVQGPRFLVETVAAHQPGDTLSLTVVGSDEGDDAERTVEVTLAADPDGADKAFLGVQIGSFFRIQRDEEGNVTDKMITIEALRDGSLEDLDGIGIMPDIRWHDGDLEIPEFDFSLEGDHLFFLNEFGDGSL